MLPIVFLLVALAPQAALADVSVVVFSETQALLSGVNYSVTGTGTVHHTICDLQTGTGSYDVFRSGILLTTVSVSPAQTISFDTNGGGSFAVSQHAAGADTTPPTGTISINNGAAFASSATVTLTLSATDGQSGMGSGAQMRFSNDNVNWSAAEAYATSKTWTLSAGDGAKTVYVRYKDAAGNWMTTSASDSITVDTTPPTGTISINNGAAFASSATVSLTLSATDGQSGMGSGAQMRFSNDNSNWSAAEPYAASKTWTVTAGDGVKTVYVRYKDVAGNWMTTSASDSITLDTTPVDTTPPTGSISINNNATFARSTGVTLTLSASDTQSGMGSGSQMRFSNDNVNWSTAEPYATSKAWTLAAGDGAKTVYVRYKDVAGNWMSTSASDSVILDTVLPTASISSPADGAKTNQISLTISGSAGDANGIASVRVNNVTAQTSNSFANWTASVPLVQGTNQVTVTVTDIPGNVRSGADSISVSCDTIPPSQPAPPSVTFGG